jgi:hypothetical protein
VRSYENWLTDSGAGHDLPNKATAANDGTLFGIIFPLQNSATAGSDRAINEFRIKMREHQLFLHKI